MKSKSMMALGKQGVSKVAISLVATLLLIGAVEAWAIPLGPGGFVLTPGTTLAARPELLGTVIADPVIPFTGTDVFGNVLFTGSLQARVVREDVLGTLDFYYRIFNDATSLDGISRLSTTNFSSVSTDVDWRIDGLGTVAPTFSTRSITGSTVSFDFEASPVLPGQESRFMFIKTDVTEFGPGSTVLINGGRAAVETFAPVPEPASLILLGSGLAGLGLWGRKRLKGI